MDGIFIIGTDTGVGKTWVAAGLLKLLYGHRKAVYWKPVQTNTIIADDTKDVRTLLSLPNDAFLASTYRFAEPLSPRMAAKKWGKSIDIEAMSETYRQKVADGTFVVVEGAGGLLVPYSDTSLQADFIAKLGVPILLVGSDKVGTINQALLTIDACRERHIPVLGVILTRSRGSFGNAESIAHFGKVEILGEFSPSEDVRNLVAQVGASSRLRHIFKVSSLPS